MPRPAAYLGNDEGLLQDLIDAGAPLEARNGAGMTALAASADQGRLRSIELLLAAGAQPDAHGERGATPLMAACRAGHLEVVQTLIAAGASVNAAEGESNSTSL